MYVFTWFLGCVGFSICCLCRSFLLDPGLACLGGGAFCFPLSRILQKMKSDDVLIPAMKFQKVLEFRQLDS